MTHEELQKLVLQVTGAKDVAELVTKLDSLKTAVKGTETELGGLAAKSIEAAQAIGQEATATEEAGTKTKASLSEVAEGGKALFSAFKDGDVGDAVKQIGGLVAMVPGLGGWAAAIAVVGGAAAVAWPLLKEWYGYLSDTVDKMGDATKVVYEYTEALHAANVELKESDALEKAREADKAARETPTSREKDRADVLQSMLGQRPGHTEEALQDITQAIHDERVASNKGEVAALEHEYQKRSSAIELQLKQFKIDPGIAAKAQAELKAMREERLKAIFEGEQKEAEEKFARAQKGDANAIHELQALLPEGSTTGEMMRLASPDEQEAQRAGRRDAEEQRQRFAEEQKRAEAMRRARDQVQRTIKSEVDRHAREMTERAHAEARGPAHAAADAARQQAEDERAAKKRQQQEALEEKQRPTIEAQQRVRAAARDLGVQLTPEQSLQAARASFDLSHQGVGAMEAAYAAVKELVMQMRRTQGRLQQLGMEFQRLGTGPDTSGNYSLSPMMPGGY